MMRLVKRLLGSRWLKWAVVVIAVGIGAYAIDKEWNQVHHALGEIGLLASFEALLALLVMQFATLRQWQVLLAGLGSPLRTTTAGRICLHRATRQVHPWFALADPDADGTRRPSQRAPRRGRRAPRS